MQVARRSDLVFSFPPKIAECTHLPIYLYTLCIFFFSLLFRLHSLCTFYRRKEPGKSETFLADSWLETV